MSDERARTAYASYRGGFHRAEDAKSAPPHWDDLQAWVRDAIRVAYLQGTLDGPDRLEYRMDGTQHWQP